MKFNKHNFIYLQVAETITQLIKDLYPSESIDFDSLYSQLSRPPKSDMGDIAFGCFIISKALKKSPADVSKELQNALKQSELILEAKSFGPYLNFYLNPKEINKIILTKILSNEFFENKLINNAPKTIIEFSQPNTHKEMHVGHMRNLCLGDALIKLHRYAGVETIATTFPGDVGTHVAKCLWYYKKHCKESPPKERKGAWLGTLYTKGNNLLEEQRGSEFEVSNREELTAILKQLHAGSGEYFELWKETRQWSLDLMNSVYDWANVKFDSWYWESDVDASSVSLVKKYYDKGLFIEDEGAIGIDLKEYKLGFCLLLKSDGTGLYATKDLELARRKFDEQGVERSIYVVDNRQALHFKQVFKTLELMGFPHAKDCYHLEYEMVELTDGAMSSRKGNIVPLQDLIDQMILKIKTDYLNRYKDEWSEDKINHTANIVAAGAIKYGMTKIDSHKKIVFDMSEWLKLDGESGPYIQYVHARINSLLQKTNLDISADFSLLDHTLEKELILKLNQFNDTVESALKNYKIHLICTYLYELSKSFNSFYAECSVLNANDENLKNARVKLCQAVKITISKGLGLIGIEAPDSM